MPGFALLVLPAANRVYAQASADLGVAELEATLGVTGARVETIGGVRYIAFSAEDPDVQALSRLSVAYALFERDGDLLRPVALPNPHRYDDDLLTIQRYTGKTNEHFTKLLMNLAVPAGATTVLDPLAGRGTTLNQAVLYGLHGIGVEIDAKDCEAYRTFFTTWLKNKRLPHKARNDKHRFTVEFAPDRASLDAGRGQRVEMINGDSRTVDTLVKGRSVDAIVADLPYGVRHGAHRSSTDRQRSPLDLVEQSLASWRRVLRGSGRLGLAFNTKVSPRKPLVELLEAAGFRVVSDDRFEHRVDQAITRDLVVATAPSA